MKPMTERQEAIYKFIVEYVKSHVYPPSIREIGNAVGLRSTSSVFCQLETLEKRGLIEIGAKEPRAIKLRGYSVVSNELLIGLYEFYTQGR